MDSNFNMDVSNPEYVLRFDEAMPVTEHKGFYGWIHKTCIIVFIILLVSSLLFRTNMFSELPGYTIGTFIAAFVLSLLNQHLEWKPSPVELQFHKDKLVIYRDRCYYSERVIRREWIEMYYADTTRFDLRKVSKRLSVSGKQHGIYYKYKKDGSLSEKPCYNKIVNAGYTINLQYIGDIDIVKEIETHSPLRVREVDA